MMRQALALEVPPCGLTWEAVAQFVECTVCFDSITGPIYQCSEGHLLCSLCWGRLNRPCAGCPTCSGVLGNIRCRFAESIRDAVLHASDPFASAKKLPSVPRHKAVKVAAERIGVGMEDLRGVMAREGVGLMEAVVLAARSRVKGEIEESGGVDGYEKKKRVSARTAAVAVALDAAQSPPYVQSPRKPPAKHSASKHPDERERGSVQASTESLRKASSMPSAAQEGECGQAGDIASKPLTQSHTSKTPGASGGKALATLGLPRKMVPSEPVTAADDKLAKYREDIRKKADTIWNEAVPEPVAKAGPSLKSHAVVNGTDREPIVGLQLTYDPSDAKPMATDGDKLAPQKSSTASVSPKKPTESPYSRPAFNTDVMAAYSNFRKDMKSKIISTMRASHDATLDVSEQPPPPLLQAAPVSLHLAVQSLSSPATTHLLRISASQVDVTAEAEAHATEATQTEHMQPRETGTQEQRVQEPLGCASRMGADTDVRCDKRSAEVRSPMSDAGNKTVSEVSEAQTRSNSANLDSSASSLASIYTIHQGQTATAGSRVHQNVETESQENTKTQDDVTIQSAASGIPSDVTREHTKHAVRRADTSDSIAEGGVSREMSSLQKLRFPQIRTDIVVKQVQDDFLHAATASHGATQSAREFGSDKRLIVAAPPTARPPSTARSLRVERSGSRPTSSTPRDTVRTAKSGDTSGSGVWHIVAGVRNRLRAGPGR